MDKRFRGHLCSINGNQMRSQPQSAYPNEPISNFRIQNIVAAPRLENSIAEHRFKGVNYLPPDPNSSKVARSSSVNHEDYSLEDCDFSDAVLRYINKMLMEEDMGEKTCLLQDSFKLQAAEKSFYEVLGKKYPPSLEQNVHENRDSPNGSFMPNLSVYQSPKFPICSNISQSTCSVVTGTVDGLADSQNSTIHAPDWSGRIQTICQFKKGVEEATKFLPIGNNPFVNLDVTVVDPPELNVGTNDLALKEKKKDEGENSASGMKGRKNLSAKNLVAEEERSRKQIAIYPDLSVRSELFDMVLLSDSLPGQTAISTQCETLQNGTGKLLPKNGRSKVTKGGKGHRKKQNGKKEEVDVRALLIRCGQAIAADDHQNVNELLTQIKQYASLVGDGNQRLAQCFADALDARLAGTGSQIYKGIVSKRTSTADILRGYRLHVAVCPFRKVSNFIANKTINMVAGNSMRLHVIDFGILYGFQWPTLIQRLSMRQGGPTKLRITGIDILEPGFRPAERVEETGLRLAAYAKEFKVPFEFNGIAKRWDAIKVEELKIDEYEVIAVNCLYRAKCLLDESAAVDSPKNVFLNLIRQINPDIFIHGIVNGGYNSPFFVTRFREALFHFSAMFDMLDTLVPRDNPDRLLIERDRFRIESLNVIGCEGWERVERPETYRQWQIRNQRAGFVQFSFDRETVKEAIDRVRSHYHKDFMIDETRKWLVQGWKGKTLYAISSWKPAQSASILSYND
ncbi:hypothetical protein SLA2020_131460 [Shorea laevis]